jgi:hemolysin activation/secretion protein
LEPSVPTSSTPSQGDETIFIQDFILEGADQFPEAKLRELLAPYKERNLTLAQIREAADLLTKFYRENGYMVATAFIPPQDARSGKLLIRVQIGRYGQKSLENQSLVRDQYFQNALKYLQAGAPIRSSELERLVLLIGDLPGADIPKLSMSEGQAPGTADFLTRVPPKSRFGGYFIADNSGSRYTGRRRFMAGVDVNSPFNLGDRLSVNGLISENRGLQSVGLNYSFPLSANGLRLELAYFNVFSRLGEEYEDLEVTGKADIYQATLSYPLIRRGDRNLRLSLTVAHKQMEDKFIDVLRRKISYLSLNLENQKWTTLLGKNFFAQLGGALTVGRLTLPDPLQKRQNQNGANSVGNYAKFNLNGALGFSLTNNLILQGLANFQKSLTGNLDSSEQMSVTGQTGVRAYREIISGDEGYYLATDLVYNLPGLGDFRHSLGIFADISGWRYKNGSYALKDSDTLSGAGLSYTATFEPFTLSLQLTRALGSYPEEIKNDGRTHLLAKLVAVF